MSDKGYYEYQVKALREEITKCRSFLPSLDAALHDLEECEQDVIKSTCGYEILNELCSSKSHLEKAISLLRYTLRENEDELRTTEKLLEKVLNKEGNND